MNKIALTCFGILSAAVAGSQLVLAVPSNGSFTPGATYTVTGQEPSSEVSVAVLPTSSFVNVSGTADKDGQFSFTLPTTLTSGEYSVLTTKGVEGFHENSTFTVGENKRMIRSFEEDSHEHDEHRHNHHSDHSSPHQTWGGGPQFVGFPAFGGGGGFGRESITAIAANSAGSSASAKIGLVSLASLLGAVAFF